MSFAQSYQPVLLVLIAFGLYPIIYNTKTKLFESSRISLAYAIVFNISLTSFTVILFGYRIADSLDELNQIYVLVNLLQSMICSVIQISMVTACLCFSSAHVGFLNDILEWDRKINLILRRNAIDDESFVQRHVLETFSFIIAYLLVVVCLDHQIHHIQTYWFYIAWKRTIIVRLCVQILPGLHIRFCAKLITRRLRVVILELKRVNVMECRRMYYNSALMQFYTDLYEFKDRFERIFGFGILLDHTHELLTAAVMVYMTIMYALELSEPRLFWLTILMFGLSISRQAMHFSAVNELSNQDQKLPITKTRNSNYMQLQQVFVLVYGEESKLFLIFSFSIYRVIFCCSDIYM